MLERLQAMKFKDPREKLKCCQDNAFERIHSGILVISMISMKCIKQKKKQPPKDNQQETTTQT